MENEIFNEGKSFYELALIVFVAVSLTFIFIISISADWYVGHSLSDSNLLAYYQLNETSGTNVKDDKGTHDGTAYGTIPRTAGQLFDGSYDFDGSADIIWINDSADFDGNNKMSFSMWVYGDSLTVSDAILTKYNNTAGQNTWYIQTANGGGDELEFYVMSSLADNGNAVTTTNANLANAHWYHIAFVYDGTLAAANRAKIFVDGVQKTTAITGTIPTSMTSGTAPVLIGREPSLGRAWNGKIDEVRIYDDALTLTEVQALYSCRAPDGGHNWHIISNCTVTTQNVNNALSLNLTNAGNLTMKTGTNATMAARVITAGRHALHTGSNFTIT
jgi:hypothetical protein